MTSQCTGRTNSALDAPQRMRFGMGSCVERALHDAGQQARGRWPGLRALEVQEFALAFGDARERADLDAALLRELESRPAVGLPSLSNAALTGGPLSLMALRRLHGGEIAHQHGEPARRGEGTHFAVRQRRLRRGPCECRRRKRVSSSGSASGGSSSVPSSTRKSRALRRSCRHLRRGWPASESRAPRGCRNRPAPPRAPACARAGCSAGAR